MKALLIVLLVFILIITYGLYIHRSIEILDRAGCRGSFIEWFTVFCPILHIIICFKYRKICEFNTFWSFFKGIDKQFNTMKKNLDETNERYTLNSRWP